MNDRLKFRAYFEETISDSEDNGYIFKFCLNDIAIFDSDMIGIYADDFKEQIRQAFEKFKEKNPKLTEDDLQHIIEEFYEDNSCDNEDWLNISRFESIVQSTGLKDKNGKLVFENDIVNTGYGFFVIQYCDTCKQYQLFDGECFACLGDFHWYEFIDELATVEVIGNIHQNSELLEKGGK